MDNRATTYDVRFGSIQQQFIERDVRTEQAATASASALAAALQAAKEAVFEQAQAAAKAAEKTELSTTKQIDQIQLQIKTISDSFADRIAELKERIDRGEGQSAGATGQRTETRLNAGSIVSGALLLIALLTFIILYVAKK
jgi:anthranilate/para-aminobenzoate synthase component I